MRPPTKALLLGGGLLLSFSLGTLFGNTEVQTVKVPVVETHVVTKTVTPDPQTVTLPQSCVDAIKLAELLAVPDSTITKASGAMVIALSDVTRDAATRDMTSLNQTMEELRKQKSILGDAVIADTATRERLNEKLIQCQSEIKGQ